MKLPLVYQNTQESRRLDFVEGLRFSSALRLEPFQQASRGFGTYSFSVICSIRKLDSNRLLNSASPRPLVTLLPFVASTWVKISKVWSRGM